MNEERITNQRNWTYLWSSQFCKNIAPYRVCIWSCPRWSASKLRTMFHL